MEKIIVVNIEKCMGCHSCELACAVSHSKAGTLAEMIQNGERPGSRIVIEAIDRKPVPVNCSHCETALCMIVCPSGAIQRKGDKEPVIIDPEKCIGCRLCVQACPFGMVILNPEGKGVIKCDLCIERLEDGKEPACVSACPASALRYLEGNEAGKVKRKNWASYLVMAGRVSEKDE